MNRSRQGSTIHNVEDLEKRICELEEVLREVRRHGLSGYQRGIVDEVLGQTWAEEMALKCGPVPALKGVPCTRGAILECDCGAGYCSPPWTFDAASEDHRETHYARLARKIEREGVPGKGQ